MERVTDSQFPPITGSIRAIYSDKTDVCMLRVMLTSQYGERTVSKTYDFEASEELTQDLQAFLDVKKKEKFFDMAHGAIEAMSVAVRLGEAV